jgi:hypothetical protein
VSTGKYHVEQDPQFALVHLQFVHWADKLLKVINFNYLDAAVWAAFSAATPVFLLMTTITLSFRTLGTVPSNALCTRQSPPMKL